MTLNADLVRARCAEIEESVGRLERFQALSRELFLSDRDAQDIASYRLMVAIEAALALCYHVSSKQLHQMPEEYAECFKNLGEARIIPEDLSQRLQRMARFRNVLVHMYWKIDYGQVYDVIQRSLGDLRAFSTAIAQLL